MSTSSRVFVAIGSNLGSPSETVLRAMDRLESLSLPPFLRSSLWQTAPVDCPPGSPPFVNAMVGFEPRPGETPETLLLKLQNLEREFGRRPKQVRNEPRPLDLDLIAFGTETRRSANLTLPHHRAAQRAFVLFPLNEIAPELVLTGQDKSVAELLAALPPGPPVTKLG